MTVTGITSTSVVNYHLNKLESWGYIERAGNVSRGMRLVAGVPGTRGKKYVKPTSRLVMQIDLMGPKAQVLADAREAISTIEAFIANLEGTEHE